eukprot:CAMPEP_0170545632 /NCGR_PEP_ID=MMETSP0211-20121228/3998_1 /TAXON_ID=311385 /ORGANISM="Pseudokeronopsis sp., Strain OXSARD2" /LENGTH=109 /DNA_ID=CAMNT_0010849637 /DNA_START=805 /DNA_END=1134 /DNA_ORIENTATION=-
MRILFDTLFEQAGKAIFFIGKTAAWMATPKDFVTGLVHQGNAVFVPTDIGESRLVRSWCSYNLLIAKPALKGLFEVFELLTSLSDMVGFRLAICTEVVLATVASESVLA